MNRTSILLHRSLAVVAILLFASAGAIRAQGGDPAEQAMNSIRPEAIRAGIRFLSDDSLEGRGTGTRGYDIAAKYMASQFEALGLQPAGDNGTYFQAVPLRSSRPDEAKTVLTLTHAGNPPKLSCFGKITFPPAIPCARRAPWKRPWCSWAEA